MLGMPTSMFSVSQTTITSDLIRSLVDLEELHQVLRADLLLALDEHLDVDRQRVAGLAVGGDGAEEGGDRALVVGGAAGEEPAVAARQLPRVGLPLLDEVDRLHVVVGVQEDGRLAGRVEPLAVGVRERVADLQHLDVVQARRAASGRR